MESSKGYPFVNVKAMSDGPVGNGSGTPYFLMTGLDMSGIDLEENKNMTVLTTLAQTAYCKENDMSAQDPACPRVILTGKFEKVTSQEEYNFARKALIEKHSIMSVWIDLPGHGFYIAKMNVEQVILLDNYGPVKHVTKEDYFKVNYINTFKTRATAGNKPFFT